MELFTATLSQMGYLFSFIFLGFVLMKIKALPAETAKVISKLENNLLLPAMVFNTFANQFTVSTLKTAWRSLLCSVVILFIAIGIALAVVRFITGDKYLRNIYTYGLCFANFGFMGYAVVQALFPEYYLQYLIYTMPMWTAIYLWGTPVLLIADAEAQGGWKERLKSFVNPMFVCMIVGIVFGLADLSRLIPAFAQDVIDATQSCMSPLAMMLVGVTLAGTKLKTVFTDVSVYVVSLIRLVAIPALFIVVAKFIPLDRVDYVCALVSLAMPLGLTTIVVPAAYGRDTSKASGMALISHAISCITIPLIFLWGC